MNKQQRYHNKVKESLELTLSTPLSSRQAKALATLRDHQQLLKALWGMAEAMEDTRPDTLKRLRLGVAGIWVGTCKQEIRSTGSPIDSPSDSHSVEEVGTESAPDGLRKRLVQMIRKVTKAIKRVLLAIKRVLSTGSISH